ncbi:hypothetical protein [Mycobacterium sp. KBS0706]|uniref:hypothetical protein n=1 Tax=Mycobacterium sp. KBS0706 TaxID=2578109 RepID=UPI00163D5A6E|nr:hypothetical protein [Mycobacterium sp. KBS0706]
MSSQAGPTAYQVNSLTNAEVLENIFVGILNEILNSTKISGTESAWIAAKYLENKHNF